MPSATATRSPQPQPTDNQPRPADTTARPRPDRARARNVLGYTGTDARAPRRCETAGRARATGRSDPSRPTGPGFLLPRNPSFIGSESPKARKVRTMLAIAFASQTAIGLASAMATRGPLARTRCGRVLLAPTAGAARWRSWRYLAHQRLCTRWHTLGRVRCCLSSEPRPLSTADLCLSGSAICWPGFEPLVALPDRGLALESRCTSARSARQRMPGGSWRRRPRSRS
jgi:hypothetical protein